jgi:threonine dehydrogenase-like Zn-dependent dehydrogenase
MRTEHIKEVTHGHGVAAAFDFVGSDATLSLAVGSTRALGKVTQIGLAGGTARLKALDNSAFEVQFEATLWGTIKELREVLALAAARVLGRPRSPRRRLRRDAWEPCAKSVQDDSERHSLILDRCVGFTHRRTVEKPSVSI